MADSGHELPLERKLSKPWKYYGYPALSRFLAGDPDRLLLRRFDELHVRALLVAQDEICLLEDSLRDMDMKYMQVNGDDHNNGTVRDEKIERKEILAEISTKLIHYDKLYLRYLELRAREKPEKRSIRNLRRWLKNHEGAIVADERKFLDREIELMGVAGTPRSLLRSILDPWIAKQTNGLLKIFSRVENGEKGHLHDEGVFSSDDDAVSRVADVLVFFVGILLLITPLWALQAVYSTNAKLGLVTGFLLLFMGVLWTATVAGPFHILAATAAYAAVLATFIEPTTP